MPALGACRGQPPPGRPAIATTITRTISSSSSNSTGSNHLEDPRKPLLEDRPHGQRLYTDHQLLAAKPAPGVFRFLLAAIVLAAIAANSYANYTMYIAAIEMVSNDVLAAGMTQLRAKHLSRDPLRAGANAAAPGTCPVATELAAGRLAAGSVEAANKSVASLREQRALALDSVALFSSVQERLASGQLVDWTINQRGLIFTAHTLGTILLALPISRLGLVYGPKTMISLCILVAAARMLLLPYLAGRTPFWLLLAFELIMGGPGGSIGILAYPLAAAWLQPDEANLFVALGQMVTLIGNAATNFVSTQLLANHISWPWCYYLPGECTQPYILAVPLLPPVHTPMTSVLTCCYVLAAALSLLLILWLLFGADRPELSRFVSPAERDLLDRNSVARRNELELLDSDQAPLARSPCRCPPSDSAGPTTCPARRLSRKPNWWIIFTCPTVWALIAVYFAYHWNAKVATLWPTFFANMLHLDAVTVGIMTGVKGLVALLFGSTFVFLTRKLAVQRPWYLSLTAYRRINQLLATLVLAVSVALMVLLDCDFWANFASVLLTPLVTSFNAISHEQMPLDLSAEDSGLLLSVIRLLSVGDIPALPVSSYILSFAPDALAGDRPTWRLVWLLGLAIKLAACLLFVLVARSEPKSYSRLEPSGPCRSLAVVQ